MCARRHRRSPRAAAPRRTIQTRGAAPSTRTRPPRRTAPCAPGLHRGRHEPAPTRGELGRKATPPPRTLSTRTRRDGIANHGQEAHDAVLARNEDYMEQRRRCRRAAVVPAVALVPLKPRQRRDLERCQGKNTGGSAQSNMRYTFPDPRSAASVGTPTALGKVLHRDVVDEHVVAPERRFGVHGDGEPAALLEQEIGVGDLPRRRRRQQAAQLQDARAGTLQEERDLCALTGRGGERIRGQRLPGSRAFGVRIAAVPGRSR